MKKVKHIGEGILHEPLTFLQYSNHWVYRSRKNIVKCSDTTLEYEIEVANYLSGLGFPALTERSDQYRDGYHFYIYQRGKDKIAHSDVTQFLGSSLSQLHQLNTPKGFKFKTFQQELRGCMDAWKDGYSLLTSVTVEKIKKFVEKALDLPDKCITHGDPIYSNVVRLDGQFYLIDWEHASIGPPELDLAVLKYIECFGEPAKSFGAVASAYGSFDEARLAVLLEGRVASSLLWYAHNIVLGLFDRTEEIDIRSAWLNGDRSVLFTKAV